MDTTYLKMYIAVLDEVPAFIVPTLVAHTVINAHRHFIGDPVYDDWLENSYRKVVVKVSRKEFEKIKLLNCFLGHENKTLNGEKSCAVVLPVCTDAIPNVLKYAKLWSPF